MNAAGSRRPGGSTGQRPLWIALRYRERRRRASAVRSSRLRWVVLLAVSSLLLLMFTSVAGAILFVTAPYLDVATNLTPADQIVAELPKGGARIYDRNGELLYSFVGDDGERRPVSLAEISPWMIAATLAVEDPTFFDNAGIDPRGLARATLENLTTLLDDGTLGGSGGSTITQQLARNLYMDSAERAERSLDRKAREAMIALELTRTYEKEQLLEWYLNSISYGGIYLGVEAAAQGFFGKSAANLTLGEAALLAGVPQSPARYNPALDLEAARERQRVVLTRMEVHGMVTAGEAAAAAVAPIEVIPPRDVIEAAHFVFGPVLERIASQFGERALYEAGLEIRTTLDLALQRDIAEILDQGIAQYEHIVGGHNGAVYIVDPTSGQVLVYLGSREYGREDIDGNIDSIRSLNSPGSALKPFTYMAAFQDGWGTGTGIIDTPLSLVDAATGGEFEVRNPISQYQGVVTVASALGNSLNVPAVRTLQYAGLEDVLKLMRQAGFVSLDSEGGYGPALTVGGADITLEDLVYAYSTIATGGIMRGTPTFEERGEDMRQLDPITILEVTDSTGDVIYSGAVPEEQRIIEASYTYMVTDILTNPQNTCLVFSRCGALTVPGLTAAVKTGTSEPFTNATGLRIAGETWAVGYTTRLVAGVWYGNADNSPLHGALSTQVAWPVLRDVLIHAHDYLSLPREPFTRPSTVVSQEVCWPSGKLPTSACPNRARYTSLFAQESFPTTHAERLAAADTWWSRSGNTLRLTLPYEQTVGWTGLNEWYVDNGLATADPDRDSLASDLRDRLLSLLGRDNDNDDDEQKDEEDKDKKDEDEERNRGRGDGNGDNSDPTSTPTPTPTATATATPTATPQQPTPTPTPSPPTPTPTPPPPTPTPTPTPPPPKPTPPPPEPTPTPSPTPEA